MSESPLPFKDSAHYTITEAPQSRGLFDFFEKGKRAGPYAPATEPRLAARDEVKRRMKGARSDLGGVLGLWTAFAVYYPP